MVLALQVQVWSKFQIVYRIYSKISETIGLSLDHFPCLGLENTHFSGLGLEYSQIRVSVLLVETAPAQSLSRFQTLKTGLADTKILF